MAKDYDDLDRPRSSGGELGPLDGMYKNKVIVILLHIFCNGLCLIPVILAAIVMGTGKDPEAKANAKLGLIISAVMFVVAVIFNFAFGGMAMIMGNRGNP